MDNTENKVEKETTKNSSLFATMKSHLKTLACFLLMAVLIYLMLPVFIYLAVGLIFLAIGGIVAACVTSFFRKFSFTLRWENSEKAEEPVAPTDVDNAATA